MIQSLLIANRGEIACRIISAQILPGTGRGTARSGVEGAHGEVCAEAERWDPSVRATPCHLPGSGRV
jgi:hypothetical protein